MGKKVKHINFICNYSPHDGKVEENSLLNKDLILEQIKNENSKRLSHSHFNLKKFKIVKKPKTGDIRNNLPLSHNFKSQNYLDEKFSSNMKYNENHAEDLFRLKDTLNGELGNSQTPSSFKLMRKSYTDLTAGNENFLRASTSHLNFRNKSTQIETPQSLNTPNPKFQIYEKSLFKTFHIDQKENVDSIEKIKKIIEHNEYLEGKNRLPKISSILDQESLKSIKIKLKNNKIMGEKYNPMNFYHNQSKSTTRRNIYGGLFLH